MSLIDNPYTFGDVDFSAPLFTEYPSMSDLLQDPPVDDGYATTVDEEELHEAPKFTDFSFPDLKLDPFYLPYEQSTNQHQQQQPENKLESESEAEAGQPVQDQPSFALPPNVFDAAPASSHSLVTNDEDTSSGALLQVLTQAALQQQGLPQSSPPTTVAPSPSTSPSSSHSPHPNSAVSPAQLSPASTPALPSMVPTKQFKQEDAPSPPSSIQGSVAPTSAPYSTKRKRCAREASDLLDLDAPVQKRTYRAPSATSRKELPPQPDEGGEVDGVQALLAKRHKNTMAARQSRRRKAEELESLQSDNAQLAALNAELERRLQDAETELAMFRLRFGQA